MLSPEEIGTNLLDLRTSKKLMLREVRDLTGIGLLTINRLEKGELKRIDVYYIERLAEVFGVNPKDIMFDSDLLKKEDNRIDMNIAENILSPEEFNILQNIKKKLDINKINA